MARSIPTELHLVKELICATCGECHRRVDRTQSQRKLHPALGMRSHYLMKKRASNALNSFSLSGLRSCADLAIAVWMSSGWAETGIVLKSGLRLSEGQRGKSLQTPVQRTSNQQYLVASRGLYQSSGVTIPA